MSSGTISDKVSIPEGFAKWAKTYFGMKDDGPEVSLDLDILFNNPYMRMRETLDIQLSNAGKVPELKATIDTQLKTCDREESIPKLQKLISEVNKALQARRTAVEVKLNKLYDDTIFARLDLQRDPNEARDTIRTYLKTWDVAEAEREVKLFEEQIKRSKSTHLTDTDTIEKRHEQTNLQNSQYARNAHQAKSIATRLIDGDGNINLAASIWTELSMVDGDDLSSLMEEIRAGKHEDLPQSEHALAILKKLQNDEAFRNKLTQVVKPSDKEGEASNLIRSTLGLDPKVEITDAHAKQAALSGLLFQARQGQVGSCFTTATACMVQRNRPDKFLDDITSLFSNGKLTRTIKHPTTGATVTIDVPLNITLLQGNLEKKSEVKRDKSELHLAPDFVASMDSLQIPADEQKQAFDLAARQIRAERALAKALESSALKDELFASPNTREAVTKDVLEQLIANPSLTIRDALSSVFNARSMTMTTGTSPSNLQLGEKRKNGALSKCDAFDLKTGSDSIKPEELIDRIVKSRVSEDKQKVALEQARNAFLGQQDNLVMRAWEYSVATMVEKMPGQASNQNTIQRGLKAPSSDVLTAVIDNTGFTPQKKQVLRGLRDRLLNEFEKLVKDETETRYDPSVKSREESTSKDGHSSSGGYCLFFKNEKIASDSDYKNAMETLLNKAWAKINDGTLKQFEQDEGAKLVTALAKEFDKPEFHEKVVEKAVGSTDKKAKDKMAKPWTYEGGGNTDSLLQIYYDSPDPLQRAVAPSTANTAEQLGEFLLDTMKAMGIDKSIKPDSGFEQSSIPVRTIGVHAFNLLPSSPGITMLLKGFDDPKEGLKAYKKIEKEKIASRNSQELPLNDPPDGVLKSMIEAASTIFADSGRAKAVSDINKEFKATGKTSVTITIANTLIRAGIIEHLKVNYTQITATERETHGDSASERGFGKANVEVVPKQEFEPMVNLCMDKLNVPEDKQDSIRKEVMKTLKDLEAKDRAALLKVIEDELTKQGAVGVTVEKLEAACKVPRGIVIADGNWGGGDHRTVMTLLVSPKTGELELWQMNEDGTEASKMDEKTWVKDNRWAVFNDPREYGGVIGNLAWEKLRGEMQGKLDECVAKRVGDISMMQATLEIADDRFEEGQQEQADKAMERLRTLTTTTFKLIDQKTAACTAVDLVEKEVAKVATPAAAIASKQIKSLSSAIQMIRSAEEIDTVVKRFAKLCNLLKAAQQPLGVSADVESLLKQTA